MMMTLVLLLTILGVVIALVCFGHRTTYSHSAVGITILAICVVQAMMGMFARPAKTSQYRQYFNWAHRTLGGSLLILGASNVITGTLNFKLWWNNCTAPALQWTAVGLIAFFVLVAVVFEVIGHQYPPETPLICKKGFFQPPPPMTTTTTTTTTQEQPQPTTIVVGQSSLRPPLDSTALP